MFVGRGPSLFCHSLELLPGRGPTEEMLVVWQKTAHRLPYLSQPHHPGQSVSYSQQLRPCNLAGADHFRVGRLICLLALATGAQWPFKGRDTTEVLLRPPPCRLLPTTTNSDQDSSGQQRFQQHGMLFNLKSASLFLVQILIDCVQVVLAASICTRGGKAVLSRQFREMPRSRVEALLASFPKLADSGTQHTTVEQDNVRFVYQPLDELYMVLITNRQSNILQDIDSLHLFAQVVTSTCKSLDEREIVKNAYDLLSAFDELVTLGYRENLTLSQIRTFLDMESHEERIQEIIARVCIFLSYYLLINAAYKRYRTKSWKLPRSGNGRPSNSSSNERMRPAVDEATFLERLSTQPTLRLRDQPKLPTLTRPRRTRPTPST